MLQVVWTCDDFGTDESAEYVRPIVTMLDRAGCKGVLMVIPFHQDTPLYQRPALCRVLEEALAGGHELAMHGYTHYGFEFGIVPDFLIGRDPKTIAEYEQNREKIHAMHTMEKMAERLEKGIRVWEKTFSVKPKVFRSPFASLHENLFPSLAAAGFRCDSSHIVNPTLWRYADLVPPRQPIENRWRDECSPVPFEIHPGLMEFPLMGDYTLRITDDDIPFLLSVARQDSARCESLGAPFVILSHWFCMPKNNGAAYRFWESMFEHWSERDDVRYVTLGALGGLGPG